MFKYFDAKDKGFFSKRDFEKALNSFQIFPSRD
jgi:hypothetical protein